MEGSDETEIRTGEMECGMELRHGGTRNDIEDEEIM
jgi:hypothetical protein